MGLPETFEAVRPSIVAFVSRAVLRSAAAPTPLFPEILGTGFFVHRNGIAATNRHVIDVIQSLDQLPRNPETGANAAGAFLFTDVRSVGGQQVMGVLNLNILFCSALQRFQTEGAWFGEAVPDLGFVQLDVCHVAALPIAAEQNVLRAGLPIATAGFPEGSQTVTFHERITQLTPVLRHGIISSVFPFAGPNPHGFSIDTLLQGGASGSPVFKTDEAVVVGMIASQIAGTNYTVCVPANVLANALASALANWPNIEGLPTLEHLTSEDQPADEALRWARYPIVPPTK
jgi:hypothetical protein